MSSLQPPSVVLHVTERPDTSIFLKTEHVARYLGVKPDLLRRWRCRGIGPSYVKLNGRRHGSVVYREIDVVAFALARTVLASRMPRPFGQGGRLPGGRNKRKAKTGA
jgi:Helix-turn-helix domain